MPGKLKIVSYNRTIAAIRKATGATQKEAQQAYRAAKVELGRAPRASDAKGAVVQKAAAAAPQRIAAAKRAKERYTERAIARAKAPPAKRGGAVPPARPERRGRPPGAGGGASGGGGAGRGRAHEPDYDFGGFDEEIPDDMYGDEDDSPGGE